MLKICRVTKAKVLFQVLVYALNFDLFEFSAAILEKGLFSELIKTRRNSGQIFVCFKEHANGAKKSIRCKSHPFFPFTSRGQIYALTAIMCF